VNPKRRQRLTIVLTMLFSVSVAVGFVVYALRSNINLFFTPGEIAQGVAPIGQRIRVGGLVMPGSVLRGQAGEGLLVRFDISDGVHSVPIQYNGILPDLFKEGQGIVALGKLTEEGFVLADEVLAKHDENYTPPEVQHALDQAGHLGGADLPMREAK
jgi:cytochrome c-type biogenesis protein CcmE